MAREEVWVWSGSSLEHHVVPAGNQARVVCSGPSPPTLHLFAQREEKACWRAILVSAAPQIHFFCLLHCQTETDWGASVCTAKHANLIFLSTSDLQLLNYVTFIQARLSQNWI